MSDSPANPKEVASVTLNGASLNTDRELWRERDDYYAPSLHVTESGDIGINVGGLVFVKSLREWHALAHPSTPSTDTPRDAEKIAQRFHEAYERLAPSFGYKTREASAVAWEKVPENNRKLMIAVCAELFPAPTDTPELDFGRQIERQLAQLQSERDEWKAIAETNFKDSQAANDDVASLRAEVERLQTRIDKYVEDEGAACPEDVGFREYIDSLEKRAFRNLTAEEAQLILKLALMAEVQEYSFEQSLALSHLRRISGYTSGGEK
jgi:hypothetical protein